MFLHKYVLLKIHFIINSKFWVLISKSLRITLFLYREFILFYSSFQLKQININFVYMVTQAENCNFPQNILKYFISYSLKCLFNSKIRLDYFTKWLNHYPICVFHLLKSCQNIMMLKSTYQFYIQYWRE